MATLTDKGIKDGTLIGSPNAGDYFRFMDTNNSDSLTLRDSSGVDTVYGLGVLTKMIVVNQANISTTLGGVIDSTAQYFIDGQIDCTGINIEVPATGIAIKGYSFDISGLYCTDNSHIMFTSPVGGSGNVILDKLYLSVTGTSSKIFDLTDSTGFHALEITAVNYIDCTSLGELTNYRQGLETGTGRFGGSPSLTLSGTWIGGFVILTSITRSMSDTTTEPLFKEGTAFIMNSRFKTNMNMDLGTLQPFIDFQSSNFPNSGTLQLQGCEITRDFIYNPLDINVSPNMDQTSLSSLWVNNNGISNTYVGGTLGLTTEITTTITTAGVYEVMNGTFASSDLQHFDNPVNGQLRNLGTTPREFKIITYVVVDGPANDILTVRLRKYNSTTLVTSTIVTQSATVNNFSGGADRCTFSILGKTTLDENDYYFLDIANISSNGNLTAKIGTFTSVETR